MKILLHHLPVLHGMKEPRGSRCPPHPQTCGCENSCTTPPLCTGEAISKWLKILREAATAHARAVVNDKDLALGRDVVAERRMGRKSSCAEGAVLPMIEEGALTPRS